jgi:hypothetical protein
MTEFNETAPTLGRYTGGEDCNGIPIFVGDLVRMHHFIARNRKQIYMYKKVLIVNDRLHLVNNNDLGIIPTAYCHKCLIKDAGDSIEVIEGPSINHPVTGDLTCWWERRRLSAGVLEGILWRAGTGV